MSKRPILLALLGICLLAPLGLDPSGIGWLGDSWLGEGHRAFADEIANSGAASSETPSSPGSDAEATSGNGTPIHLAQVPVETFQLDNGMEFLLVQRPELTTVFAGWVAHVGSADERPGITGISHFFEHMMFKGSHRIGTKNIDRDLEIIQEQEQIQDQLRAAYVEQRARWRHGEIDDPYADKNRTSEMVELEQKYRQLLDEQRSLMIKDEYDHIYAEAGAANTNAFTTTDLTAYYVVIPANKLELWYWMESDRLLEPVFREFYAERDVVYEERRLRTESTPTGKYDEQFAAMFWQSHPYSWPTIGWPSDLESYTLAQAEAYYKTYYAPNNLTGVLVGHFEIDEAKALAEKYFGRLSASPPPPDVITLEMPQLAEKRMDASCNCPPQIQVWYHTVALQHADSYALDVLQGLLNGPSGRLNRSLVLNSGLAANTSSSQNSNKWAGYFEVRAEAKGETTPEQLESAWYEIIDQLQNELVGERELQKVKNQIAAEAYRNLERPFGLLIQLLFYEGQGNWRYLNEWAENTLAVTAEDVQRVAKQYFGANNRAVGLYTRDENAEELPPEIAALPANMQQSALAQVNQIRASTDVESLKSTLNQIETAKASADPQVLPVLELLEGEIRLRIEELAQGGAS